METRRINSVTEYAVFKIKKCFWDSILTFIGILGLVFIILESFYHIKWIENNELVTSINHFLGGFFVTIIVICITVSLGLLVLLIYFIYVMIKQYKNIRYYNEPRFSYFERKEIDYDYKLWQTARKNTFHSQAISLLIDGNEVIFKTPVIFTNSKKIGVFKIPKVLQSHSYVRGKAEIGYDPIKKEAVIIYVEDFKD